MEDYRNKKECQYCHKEILKRIKKCPFCRKFCYPQMFKVNSPNIKRNREMATMLETGNFTLQQVGEKYNISRERVRQLYRVIAKKPYTTLLAKRRRIQRRIKIIEEETRKNTVSFYCRDCNQPVPLSEAHYHQKIICRNCYQKYQRELRSWRITRSCKQCGKTFHPYTSNTQQFLCSNACYTQYGRGKKQRIATISSVFRINNRIIQSYA